MEGGHHSDSSKIHCTMENDCSYKAEWRGDSAHFPLTAVTGYRSHAVRCVELIGYFVRFGHLILFLHTGITLSKQKRITS